MHTSWDYRLVAVSVIIAIIGSYLGLDFAGRMKQSAEKGLRRFWFLAGSFIMGLAIWSMHFIGMMALKLPIPVSYDPALSALSMLAAAVGSGLAFSIMGRKQLGWFHWGIGAVAMGLAIASMHYIGMASMRMPAQIQYNPYLFVLSVLIAISASAWALWLAFYLRTLSGWWRLFQQMASATVMGVAISGMHYTGMAAAHYVPIKYMLPISAAVPTVGGILLRDLLIVTTAVCGFILLLLNSQSTSEREHALAELRENESRFSTLFNQAAVGIAQTDLSGKLLIANQRFCEITGVTLNPQSRVYLHELVYPEALDAIVLMLRSAVEQREPIAIEERCLRPDGKLIWMTCRATPIICEESGKLPQGLIVVMQDITERKLAESALEETRERFRLLVEDVKDYAIYWLDPDGRIISWNQGAERIFGYSSENITGQHFALFFGEEVTEKPSELLEKAVQEGRLEVEIPQRKKHNQRFEAHITITPIWDRQNTLVGFSNITRDITVDKKVKQDLQESHQVLQVYVDRLEQSNQELEQFATIASHDLQAPLRKVMIYSNALQKSLAGKIPADANDYLIRMQKATYNMQSLITDLLALSRVTRKGQSFRLIHLSDILREVFLNLEEKIRSEGAHIEVDGVVSFEGDPQQIRQLLQNLLENALKFHTEGHPPLISIHARELGGNECEIAIQDHGLGFDEKYLDRIFAVFERLHSEAQYPGTGMGLAISKKIVERHRGKITAKSQPNLGSTFIVTLPILQNISTVPKPAFV